MPIEIRLPALAPDFEGGTIESWHKVVGDVIAAGDVIADIETDKAVVEIEATDSGILGKIVVVAGTADVPVNTVIGLLLQEGETVADLDNLSVSDRAETVTPAVTDVAPVPTAKQASKPQTLATPEGRLFASPLARRIALRSGVDLNTLTGRGPNGRILRADVEAASSNVTTEVADERYTAIPNSGMRKVIARRLGEAKRDIPHFYLTVDCTLDAVLELRRQFNAESIDGASAYKISVNDLIIKACALALQDVPAANASWTEEATLQYHDVDISVAVATPGGLITPIVRNADRKSLIEISSEIRDLADRARNGKLKPTEYKGGGFTISNLGMYGIKHFSAIVNPPQSCILAIGAGEQRAIVNDGALEVATVMSCTLSVDHRSVDGAIGAEFLKAFKNHIEHSLSLFLGSTSR